MEPMTKDEQRGLAEIFLRRLMNIYGIDGSFMDDSEWVTICNGLFIEGSVKPIDRIRIAEWIFLVFQGLESLREDDKTFELKRRGELWTKKVLKCLDVRVLPEKTQEKLVDLAIKRLCK